MVNSFISRFDMHSVSILMSTYNGSKFLDEQIQSILLQKEILVHLYIRDDGSDSEFVKKLKQYEKNENISIIYGNNIGYRKSFMELVKKVPLDTDYYAFSDQDDVWYENKLYLAITKINKYEENVPCAYCAMPCYVDENLKKTDRYSSFHDFLPSGDIKPEWGIVTGIFGLGCTFVWNKALCDILKKADYNNFIFGHDNFLSVLSPLVGNFYKESKDVFLYRQHGANVGAKKYKNRGLLNKLSGKLKNFTNTDSYNLREFIYKNFDTFIKNPETKQKLELSLEYKKNFIKKTKLIFSNYTNGLPFSEKQKFFLKTIFNRF